LSRQKDGPISKVSGGNPGKALRVYIPAEVTRELELKIGDHIRWATATEEGKPVAKFRKVRLIIEG
jgi:hypothetical protein